MKPKLWLFENKKLKPKPRCFSAIKNTHILPLINCHMLKFRQNIHYLKMISVESSKSQNHKILDLWGYETEAEAEAFSKSWSWSRSWSFEFLKPQSWSRGRSCNLKCFGFVPISASQLIPFLTLITCYLLKFRQNNTGKHDLKMENVEFFKFWVKKTECKLLDL